MMKAESSLNLPLGWAIVIAVLIYVVDRRDLWRYWRRVAVPVVLAIIAFLSYPTIHDKLQDWQVDRYTSQHVRMKDDVILRYKSRNPNEWSRVCTDDTYKKLDIGEKAEVVYAIQKGAAFYNSELCGY